MIPSIPARLGKAIALAAVALALAAAAPGSAAADCTCRYAGQSFALEACVCIATPEGPRLACCDKVLNNSSWTFSPQACPIAGRGDAPLSPVDVAALHPTVPSARVGDRGHDPLRTTQLAPSW